MCPNQLSAPNWNHLELLPVRESELKHRRLEVIILYFSNYAVGGLEQCGKGNRLTIV
jgi:hypothetical protein